MTAPTGTATPAQLAARRAKVERELSALRKELNAPAAKATPKKTAEAEEPKAPQRDAYRPENLDAMVGQTRLIRQLQIVMHGARLKGSPLPHLLIGGNAGTGKTSVSGILADEIGAHLVTTTGQMIKKPEDLLSVLVQATGPTVFLCDEAHRLNPRIQESLFTIMEDGTLDMIGGGETSQHHLPEMVIIAATNRPGQLLEPFRSRMIALTMTDYSLDELAVIAGRVFTKRGIAYLDSEAREVAARSRGIPRRTVALSERTCDVISILGKEKVEDGDVNEALLNFGILPNGLDEVDVRILTVLTKAYAGKPCGLSALVQSCTLDEGSYTDVIEPWLVKAGYVIRTRAGRLATRAAYELVQEAA